MYLELWLIGGIGPVVPAAKSQNFQFAVLKGSPPTDKHFLLNNRTTNNKKKGGE
jgi:hypothetical protein